MKENKKPTENGKRNTGSAELDQEEYYITKHYSTVTSALDLFKDNMLCSKPGKYYTTTHNIRYLTLF